MMPRKKRITILIVSVIITILIVLGAFLTLYFTTDLLKTNQYLFSKYIGQNINNAESMLKIFDKNEYDKSLEENKYTTNMQIKINYIEGIGTSLENTQNDINKFKITIDGQDDKKSEYSYKNIKLLNENENALRVEYIQNTNIYGIRFSDLFKQYILVDNANLKELFAKLGYEEQELESIPDQIQFKDNVESIFLLTEDEKNNIKERYLNIFNNKTLKDKVSKQSNVEINVGKKAINTNVYTLTLTVEQLNSIYIDMLEILKQDEIILSKLDGLQKELQNYQSIYNIEPTNIKESYISNIDKIINEINRNNIGNEETKIIVYESNGNTIRTSIQAVEYEMNFECLQEQGYIQMNIKDKMQQEYKILEIDNNDDEISINIEDVNGDEIKNISIVKSEEVDGNECEKNIIAKFEDGSDKIEANIKANIEKVDKFQEKVELNDENSIKLNDLEEENLTRIINTVITNVSDKINTISQNVNEEDLMEILELLGIMEIQEIQDKGISETEKNRFNAKLEILKGENLESNYILKIIEECKDNIIGMEVVSNNELKLELNINKKNEEVEKTLTTFIEKNDSLSYNVDVEYDEENGLAKYIILTIVKK